MSRRDWLLAGIAFVCMLAALGAGWAGLCTLGVLS